MSLSSRIVQRGVATIREVEEALARQVLYGGDLITNLLEVCRVDETVLMRLASEETEMALAPIGELPPASPEAQRMIAAEIGVERAIAPLSLDKDGLIVAVAEPLSRDVEQELTFALAVPIIQRLAPLVRIRQALARDYGVPLDRRSQRVLQKMLEGADRAQSSFPPPRGAPDVKLPPRPPSLMPPPIARVVAEVARAEGTPSTLLRAVEAPLARPPRRRRGPLMLDAATTELEDATERDTIFDLLFEFARQFFDYTALFIVHGDIAEGRDAYGEGAPREKVARIGVPLDLPGLLASAREAKKTVRGVGDPSGVDGVLMSDLSRPFGSECAVLPVVVRSRPVALLFGDPGEGGIDEAALGEVQALTDRGVAAFERLIVRRKLRGSIPPKPTPEAGRPRVSQRPSVEELAAPVRDLMAEPPSAAPKDTTRQPKAEMTPAPKSQPPPENLLAVRRPSGRPIPREEPESGRTAAAPAAAPAEPPRTRSSSMLRRATAPPLEFSANPASSPAFGSAPTSAPETTRDAAPPAMTDPPPRSSKPGRVLAIVDDEPTPTPRLGGSFDGDETPAAPAVSPAAPGVIARVTSKLKPASSPSPNKPMPASEQIISVAAHRPPTSRLDSALGLPSVIVDVSSEYAACVERVLGGDGEDADEAEGELLRAGAQAMPAIMARFPGPVTIKPERLLSGTLPRAAECGPILRLVARQRRTALPSVLALVEDDNADKRFWATYLLTELVYPEAVEAALARVFDEDGRVRRAARAAARALAEAHPAAVVDRLAPIAQDASAPKGERLLAIDTLGETREPLAVEALVPALEDRDREIKSAARTALVTVTRQDFGTDPKKWQAWWTPNRTRHRLEWLIDALTHEQAVLRAAAGEELKSSTKEFFGYHDDLPKRERERAQSRYRDWWSNVGRVRFSRAASRGK